MRGSSFPTTNQQPVCTGSWSWSHPARQRNGFSTWCGGSRWSTRSCPVGSVGARRCRRWSRQLWAKKDESRNLRALRRLRADRPIVRSVTGQRRRAPSSSSHRPRRANRSAQSKERNPNPAQRCGVKPKRERETDMRALVISDTYHLRATARIVPTPCSYSRRICSYSSTLLLLMAKPSSFPGTKPQNKLTGSASSWGQFRPSKGANSERNHHCRRADQ